MNLSEEGRMIVINSRSGNPINAMFKDKELQFIEEGT